MALALSATRRPFCCKAEGAAGEHLFLCEAAGHATKDAGQGAKLYVTSACWLQSSPCGFEWAQKQEGESALLLGALS